VNQAFSKIWIIIILIVLVGGGYFGWQYLGGKKEKVETLEIEIKDGLITPVQVVTEMMEMLIREVEKKAEKEGIEFKITEEEKEELKDEIWQRTGKEEPVAMTEAELEGLKIEIEGIIWAMAEVIIQKEKARVMARDATRKADMRMIVTAQEMYYGFDWHYYQSDGKIWPSAIGSYMMDVPTDPLEDTETPYVWVDNTNDDQKFCIYATLEDKGWHTASHKGNYTCSDIKPTLNDCCF